VRSSPTSQWNATNLSGLHFLGIESSLTWAPIKAQTIRVAWTGLAGAQASLNGLQSEYALNYPVENIHATWTVLLKYNIAVTNAVAIAKPYQQAGVAAWNASPYPVWNAHLTHDSGRIRPYLRLSNLSNTGYQEINGVAMPGRSISGGVAFWLSR
jgi:iron complex outermembrane receptor protein